MTGLPAGLSIDPNSGEIAGTILTSAAGTTSTTVTANDGQSSVSQTFNWAITPLTVAAIDDRSNLEGNTVSIPVIATYVGSGNLTYSATALPVGVGINTASGLISGSVTAGDAASGPYNVDVTVTDGTYTTDVSFDWIITQGADIAPVLTNPGTQTSVVGASINLPLTFSYTVGDPLTFSAAGLPDGLYIELFAGVISGTIAEDAVSSAPALVTITATNGNGVVATQTFSWIVNDSVLTVQGASFTAAEGADSRPVTVATFTNNDPNWTPDGFSATINWGDGKTDDGIVNGANGVYTVTGNHIYNHPGNFAPIVTVTDGFRTSTGSIGTATITAAPLAMTGGFQQGEVVGTEVNGDWASFIDANPNELATTYTASINWGDGSLATSGTVTGFGGKFVVSGSHAYSAKGPFAVTVTVTDIDGTQGTAYSTAQVGEVFAGVSSTLAIASFKSSDPNATAGQFYGTVNWSDGSPTYYNAKVTQNSDGSFTVTAQHTFAVDSLDAPNSSYVVSVTITGPQFSTTVTTKNVEVVRPAMKGIGENVVATAGLAFNNVEVATFTEPDVSDTSGEYTATIYWGDGTSSNGSVEETANGEFQVLGSHTYATAGSFAFQVIVSQAWDDQIAMADLKGKAEVPAKKEGVNPLAADASLTLTVPTGVLAVEKPFIIGRRAAMEVKWKPESVDKGGFVIQHVTVYQEYRKTESGELIKEKVANYWEAWEVDAKGVVYDGYIKDKSGLHESDYFNWKIAAAESGGFLEMVGYARYTEKFPVNWESGAVKFAGSLPGTTKEPDGWTDKNTVKHGFKIKWNDFKNEGPEFAEIYK